MYYRTKKLQACFHKPSLHVCTLKSISLLIATACFLIKFCTLSTIVQHFFLLFCFWHCLMLLLLLFLLMLLITGCPWKLFLWCLSLMLLASPMSRKKCVQWQKGWIWLKKSSSSSSCLVIPVGAWGLHAVWPTFFCLMQLLWLFPSSSSTPFFVLSQQSFSK